MSSQKKKVCLVCQSLGKGGAERSTAILSFILNDLGYEVYIVTILNHIDFKFKGVLLNLGIYKNEKFNYLKRFILFKKFIRKNKIDLVIDGRPKSKSIRELIIKFFIYNNVKTLYVVHNFVLEKYFPSNNIISKLIYNSVNKIVSVSNDIGIKIKKEFNLEAETVYNTFLLSKPKKETLLDFEYILYYGRLDENHKNILFLLSSYSKSNLPNKKIKLLILGDGKDKDKYINYVNKRNLNDNIVFMDYMSNPYSIVANAKFICLTSNYEGFPMVLVESLSLGTPVVSVNCASGPNEIIQNRLNGLLVEKENEKAFIEAMNELVNDNNLYNHCKLNSIKSVSKFSYENIKNEWKELLDKVN